MVMCRCYWSYFRYAGIKEQTKPLQKTVDMTFYIAALLAK